MNNLILSDSNSKFFQIKKFTFLRDLIIDRLIKEGVLFFAININFPKYWNPEIYSKEEAWDIIRGNCKYSLKNLFFNVELIEFSYIVIEPHMKNPSAKNFSYPHLHILLGIRSIIGYNDNFIISLKEHLLDFEDINIKPLFSSLDIKQYWNYIVKGTNFIDGIGKEAFKNHYFYIFRSTNSTYDPFLDFIDVPDQNLEFACVDIIQHKHSFLNGIKVVKNKEYILINLWSVFLQVTNSFHFQNHIYKKIVDRRFSFECIGNIDILKSWELIFNSLVSYFPMQLQYLDFRELLIQQFDKAHSLVIKLPNILPTRKIYFNLVEFNDGIYNLTYDFFLSYSNPKHSEFLSEISSSLVCNKFYFVTFRNLSTPKLWLDSLSYQLKDPNVINSFCSFFGRLLHSDVDKFDLPKKNALFIVGKSNTGKSQLVAEVISNLIGKHNIGYLSSLTTFGFENIINKQLIVSDEFAYRKDMRGEYLRLLEQRPFPIPVKWKALTEFIIKAPMLIICNPKQSKLILNDKALLSRLNLFSFSSALSKDMLVPRFSEKLKNEEPKILVYCNRLFVSQFLKKKFRLSSFLTSNHDSDFYKNQNQNFKKISDTTKNKRFFLDDSFNSDF